MIVQSVSGASLSNGTHSSIKRGITKRTDSERESSLDNDNRFGIPMRCFSLIDNYEKLLASQSKTKVRNEHLMIGDISEDENSDKHNIYSSFLEQMVESDNPIHTKRIRRKYGIEESLKKNNRNDLKEKKSVNHSSSVDKEAHKNNDSLESSSNPFTVESLLKHPQLRYTKLQYSLQNMKLSSKSVSFCLNHNFPGKSYCHVMSHQGCFFFILIILGSILSTVTVHHDSDGTSMNCKQVHISLSSVSHDVKAKTPSFIQCETMNPFEEEGGLF